MRPALSAILLLAFFALSIALPAENNDSLKTLLTKTIQDTSRANTYNQLAKNFLKDSLELTKKYADSAYILSLQINYPKGKAKALYLLGEYYYYEGYFEKAARNYLKAAEYFESAKDSAFTSLLYYYTGYAYSELSRNHEAAKYFTRSIHIDSMLHDTSGLANNYNSLGITFEYLGRYKDAAESYLIALNYFKNLNDSASISSCFINLGNIYSTWANYEKALDYYLKALRIEEKMDNPSGLAVIYNNIGIIYHDWKEYDKALQYYSKGYYIEKQLNNLNGLAKSINNIAIIQEEKKNYDTALILYNKSLQIEEKLGNKNGIATSFGNLGEFYTKHIDPDTGIIYFDKALQLYVEVNNPSGIGQTYNQLGNIKARKGDYIKAIDYYKKSLRIVDTLNLVEMIRENYQDLSEAYRDAGNYPMAYYYLSKFQNLKDSLFNKEIRDKLTLLQNDFDLQKKEDEIKFLNNEQALQKLKIAQQAKANKLLSVISIITSAALLVILVITILLIKQYKQKAKANAALRKQRDELEKKGYDLQIAKEHAEESDRLKTAFLANLSHEVRTPMNGILGFADLLREENPGPEERKIYLDVITDNGHQLINILNDLLDISLIETGQVKIKKQFVALESLMNELFITHSEINKKINKGKVELIFKKYQEDQSIEVYTDHYRLKQILNNLISNAIKYTEEGFITIAYHTGEGKVEFTVEDTGIGISEENREIIFDRFRQIDDSNTRKRGGTGLGLTISKKLVEMLDGEIHVTSKINQGSKFTVNIPLNKKNQTVSSASHKKSVTKLNSELPDFSTRSILVAEDDENSFRLMHRILKSTRCKILHARNGKECLQTYAAEKNIDMVIMDLQMPEMDGMEAARKIKELSPQSQIIALSAYSHLKPDDPEIEEIFMDYLMKPVSPRELLGVINNILKKN